MGLPIKMRWTVVAAAAGLGLEGLGSAFLGPGADLAIITAAWVAMITTLAIQAEVALDKDTAIKIVGALLLSLGSFLGGTKLAVQAFSYTGVGTIPAMVANLGINAVVTYAVGVSVGNLFVKEHKIDSVDAFVQIVIASVLSMLGISQS